jgi:HlyD family secretion protein
MLKILLIILISLVQLGCEKEDHRYSGYVDVDLVYLSSDFGGRLSDLAVQRGQLVKAKQYLFKLDQTSELYGVQTSQLTSNSLTAQRQEIVSQLHYNDINYRRIQGMRKQNAASQGDLDAAFRDLNVSKQQLADLDSKIKSSQVDTANQKWRVSRKENFATHQGLIFDTYYTQGEFVQAGYPIVSLITKKNIKVVFFVPEEKLGQLRLNQAVKIMTGQNANFARGRIFYISRLAEYTTPLIFSPQERQRLVFKVEAKIDKPDLEKIHLGLPVSLELL